MIQAPGEYARSLKELSTLQLFDTWLGSQNNRLALKIKEKNAEAYLHFLLSETKK